MLTQVQKVLVFPRRIFDDYYSFLHWDEIHERLQEIQDSYLWLDRLEAEQANDLVQPIACAFIRDSEGRYCVLKRVQNSRIDLRGKVSLIVGGHVDKSDDNDSFADVLLNNLTRELDEELAIVDGDLAKPIGVIVDHSSIFASRHIAFVHEISAQSIDPRAPEEFSKRSKLTGQYLPAGRLAKLRGVMDPWSKLLLDEFICLDGIRKALFGLKLPELGRSSLIS